jgi:hypothetical protein
MTTTVNDAIVEAIKAAGFDTLAAEWRTRPVDRPRIARMVTRFLATDRAFAGTDMGERFNRLVNTQGNRAA